ncbi:hypothetical protein ABZS63_17925, partial [Streptomyces sp. NPDC005568]
MTALRPERDSSPHGEAAYGGAGAFEGAEAFGAPAGRPADPLTDPLIAQPGPGVQEEWYDPAGYVLARFDPPRPPRLPRLTRPDAPSAPPGAADHG